MPILSPFPSFDASLVQGNASDEVKELVEKYLRAFMGNFPHGFADPIGGRVKVTEVSINPNPDAPKREHATVVCELEVQQDMVNGKGNIHGGCSAYLIDICTSLPIVALVKGNPGVSQAINVVYHAPAAVGTPLRIVSKSIVVGARVMTIRGEIWDTKNSRLIVSGVQIKMSASKAKL